MLEAGSHRIHDKTSRWRMRATFNNFNNWRRNQMRAFNLVVLRKGPTHHSWYLKSTPSRANRSDVSNSEMTLCITHGVLRHHSEAFCSILNTLVQKTTGPWACRSRKPRPRCCLTLIAPENAVLQQPTTAMLCSLKRKNTATSPAA